MEITGKKFNSLTVVERAAPGAGNMPRWICLCVCGQTTIVYQGNIVRGHTKSCGCLQKASRITHGGSATALYKLWNSMVRRCTKPDDDAYRYYGGRGISVCERWLDFASFREDMGERPSPSHSLDRIDNNGHYEPGNVRWASRREQMNNTRQNRVFEIDGESHTAVEWSRISGVNHREILARIDALGWPIEEAIFTPIGTAHGGKPMHLVTARGETHTVREWSRLTGTPCYLIYHRLRLHNWEPERAIFAPPTIGRPRSSRKMFTARGQTHTVKEWANITGIPYNTLRARIGDLGWSIDKALSTPLMRRKP